MGVPDLFDYLLTKLGGNYSNNGREKIHRTEEAYETYPPKMIFKSTFFTSSIFVYVSPSLINISTENFPWNKTDKTPTFTEIPPHVTM